jgi:hypothetical protein
MGEERCKFNQQVLSQIINEKDRCLVSMMLFGRLSSHAINAFLE